MKKLSPFKPQAKGAIERAQGRIERAIHLQFVDSQKQSSGIAACVGQAGMGKTNHNHKVGR
ncbi:hypothetical protein [Quatrionicoccus australiensis]|uniref:hypothetical protein n=1 Tax=Quatrionicoccus australiensis TaxID=138118 RepID=UPI001CF8C844|nr:hypothetical protein [Quatrionicoccus australiensis]UCV13782.1 hypothetical protein KI612_12535 [Quatrionicoccus australiensis]